MKIQSVRDQIRSRFNNATGAILFSFIVLGILFAFTKIPYFNLLFSPDINLGIYWAFFVWTYRIPVQITLLVSGTVWIIAFVLIILGNSQIAETLVNNMYIVLVTAVIQQIADVSNNES